MKASKHQRLVNELYCLFIARAFLKMYLEDSNCKDIEPLNLYKTLSNMCREYSKYINPLTEKATEILEECEKDLVMLLNENRKFTKKIVLNKDKDLEVHGLVFVASIIMEQEQFKDRVLNLPYSVARKVLFHFADSNNEIALNGQILSGQFIKKIQLNKRKAA